MIEPSNKSFELPRDTVWIRNSRYRDDDRQPFKRKLHRSNTFDKYVCFRERATKKNPLYI